MVGNLQSSPSCCFMPPMRAKEVLFPFKEQEKSREGRRRDMNSSPRIPQLALCPAQQSSSVKCKSKLKFKEVHRSAAPCCVPARGPWQAP